MNSKKKAIKDEMHIVCYWYWTINEFIIIDENNQIDFSFEIVRNWWRKKMM